MFGPQRERPCPMCTSLLGAWDGDAADIEQRIALVFVARSPIERLIAWKQERGWTHHRLYCDLIGDFTRDYVSAAPTRTHPASTSSRAATAPSAISGPARWGHRPPTPGRTRAARRTSMPLWTILDTTPEGRGTDWYPRLSY